MVQSASWCNNKKQVSVHTYTHVVDSLFVNLIACYILVVVQECPEAQPDLPLDTVCPDPVPQCAFDVLKWHLHLTIALHMKRLIMDCKSGAATACDTAC